MKRTILYIVLITAVTLTKGQSDFDDQDSMSSNRNQHVVKDVLDKSAYESTESSGGGSDNGNNGHSDLTPDELNAAEIFAIVICSIVVLAVIAFIGSCLWHKVKARRRAVFVHITDNTDDESMLYMVDYDEMSIENGKLSVQVIPEDRQITTTIHRDDSKSNPNNKGLL